MKVAKEKEVSLMEFEKGLKKVFLASVGAAAFTAESAKDIANKLVEKGESAVEQGKIFNEELKHNAKKKVKEHVDVQVTKNYDNAYEAVEEMTPEERQKLKERILELEKDETDESE